MSLTKDFFDKLKRYTNIRKNELGALILSIVVLGFIVSFNDWGPGSEPDLVLGFTNFIGGLIIVGVTLLGRLFIQKIVALGADFQAEYKMWSIGLLIAAVLAFVTRGYFWFLIPGGLILHYMPGHRLGWVRYGFNTFGIGVVSLAGPFANILFAMIFRTLFEVTAIPLFHTAYLFNLIMALWMIIPIPPADGSRMFYGSRLVYMYGVGVVVSSAILLYANINIFLTILLAFIIAWIWWLIYYLIWERFNWKGPY
jgi:hypothetical protein